MLATSAIQKSAIAPGHSWHADIRVPKTHAWVAGNVFDRLANPKVGANTLAAESTVHPAHTRA